MSLSQQDFLRAAMLELELARKAFAQRIGAPWATCRKWLLPDDSEGHRDMPAIAWAAVREVLEHERLKRQLPDTPEKTGDASDNPRPPQQELLRTAMIELGLERRAFAARIGTPWGTFRKWLLPDESVGHRDMPAIAWTVVTEVLAHERLKRLLNTTGERLQNSA